MSDGPRIGYLLKKFPRLSETFVLNEILRQESLGARIHVFSRRPVDDEPRHPELERLAASVEDVPGRAELDPWHELFIEDGPQRVDLDAMARTVRAAQALGHPRLSKLFAEALWVLRRSRELELEHLHVHFATDSAIVAHLVHHLGGPTYSITAHAKDIYRDTVDATRLSRLVADSAFTVTVCDANVRHLEAMLDAPARARVRRLYNGIDVDAFQLPAAPRDARHVLGVGRLVAKKGFDVLLRALALLKARGVVLSATLVGDGEERAALVALRDELDLGDRVHFTGALDQNRVRELMARATLMALPCRIGGDGNRDALPTVLLEALAVGLPCISTPVTGIPEILDQGRAGELVPEDDPAALAEAIGALLDDPARRAELGRRGRVRAEGVFAAPDAARVLRGWFDAELGSAVAR